MLEPDSARKLPRRHAWEHGPFVDWPVWAGPVALLAAFALAIVGSLLIDIPAGIAGVRVTGSHVPGGLEIADTVVQDLAFVAAAVVLAQVGGRSVHAWQLGLRRPWTGQAHGRVARLLWLFGAVVLAYGGFLLFGLVWSSAVHATEKETLLNTLGANEGTVLLALAAALTCVVAPICEEVLFRGFLFQSLSNWRGVWPAAIATAIVFGGVHAGSAPALDLVPLGVLGLFLCLLYRWTGSLYPCIAVHCLNNCLAFASLEGWGWQITVLLPGALATIAATGLALRRVGVIVPEPAGGRMAPAVPSAT
jgi:membrane protease YdiL (CAAX protease family)